MKAKQALFGRAFVVTIGLSALWPRVSWADSHPVEAVGQARILFNDRVDARRRALEDALRRAVLRAAEAAFGEKQAETFALGNPATLVERYRIVAEGEEGGSYTVTVEAHVAMERLSALLGRLGRASPEQPRSVALVLEDGSDAALLTQALAARGLSVTQPSRERGAAELRVRMTVANEGEVRGADLLAVKVSLSGILTARSGSVQLAAHARGFEPTMRAAREAAERAASGLLADAVLRSLGSGEGVAVRLVGRMAYRHLKAYEQQLLSLPGVKRVQPRRFGRSTVLLEVSTGLSAAQIAEACSRMAIPGMKHAVERAGGREIEVRVQAEPGEQTEGLP